MRKIDQSVGQGRIAFFGPDKDNALCVNQEGHRCSHRARRLRSFFPTNDDCTDP